MKHRSALASFLLAATAACAPTDTAPSAQPSASPLVGVPGATDSADRQCHVVLRELARPSNGTGGYQTNDLNEWIWDGHVDISAAAAAEGALPSVVYQYGSDTTWWEVYGVADEDAPGADGFVRYTFRLESHLPGPGMSGTSIANARVQLVPLLHLPEGGRAFDHNRRRGDFDVYELTLANGFTVGPDALACPPGSAPPAPPAPPPPPAPPEAAVWLDAAWNEWQEQPLVAGGQLTVHYDIARLPGCRGTHNGFPAWDVIAHARFLPGGERLQGSVRAFYTSHGFPAGPGFSSPARFAVPAGATSVELWFENVGMTACQAWDSNLGGNYVFDVLAPPSWLGAVTARLSRDSSDACDSGTPQDASTQTVYDTWVRQRAAIRNVCFRGWSPGVTDREGAEIWRLLDARVHWRLDGGPWHDDPVAFDRRVGNDARWAWGLREVDPFRSNNCPEVPWSAPDEQGYVHIGGEYWFSVNSVELRPAGPGSTYRLDFVDYDGDPFRATCP